MAPHDAGIRPFFFADFLRDRRIAAVKATSPYLARRIIGRMSLGGRRVVVEYGPGTGSFTLPLLRRLSPDSRLVLIETNPRFAKALRRIRDPRLLVFSSGAQEVRGIAREAGFGEADCVLSGIPFSHFEEPLKMAILRDTRAILAPDGLFVAYQASTHLKPYLARVFPRVRVTMEPFHIPPLVVMEARCA